MNSIYNTYVSYAVACFKHADQKEPYRILYVQRRTSYYFQLVFLTKYNTKYLSKLQEYVNNLPLSEKQDILTLSEDDLFNKYFNYYAWYTKLYIDDTKADTTRLSKFREEFSIRYRFLFHSSFTETFLKLLSNANNPPLPFSLPKGRKNMNESNLDAAIREFQEETMFKKEDYKLLTNIKPYVDSYIDNHTRYTTIIYFAESTKEPKLDSTNIIQSSEVSCIRYLSKPELETLQQPQLSKLHDKLKRKYLNNQKR